MQIKTHSMVLVVFTGVLILSNALDIPFSRFNVDTNAFGHSEEHQMLKAEEKAFRSATQLSDFYSLVTIGHQSLPVLFSTTADMDFIVGKTCTNCAYTTQPFDTNQEPAFIQTTDTMTTDKGQVKGKLSMCSIKLGDESVGQTQFILAESVKYPLQHSGVISLSPKDTSFLTKMYEKGLIKDKIFSLKYSGAYPTLQFSLSEDELESYAFYQLPDKESWFIDLKGLSLGAKELSQAPSKAIFDTSTNLLMLPESMAETVLSALSSNGWECQADKTSQIGQLTCERNSIAVSFSLNLKFNENKYKISSSSFMGDCLRSPAEGASQSCTTLIAVNNHNEDTAVLGHAILKNFEILFDARESRIGLAEVIIQDSEYPRNKKDAVKEILYLLALGVVVIASLLVIARIIQKIVLKKSIQINSEEDVHGGTVELATSS